MAAAKAKQDEKQGTPDPVISSETVSDGEPYPEGTHPARPVSEVTHSSSNLKYEDNPDKPDPSSIAQLLVEK